MKLSGDVHTVKPVEPTSKQDSQVGRWKPEREWLEARQVIRDSAEGFEPDWEDGHQYKWLGDYNHSTKQLVCGYARFTESPETIYFESEEKLKQSFEENRSEWLTYMKIKEEKR